jgi:multidrug efflux pump subunit AcrA (membrane-fusion protein)
LVTPGESVKAGQVLAELDSPELESLQLEIRNAQTALNLSLKLRSSAELLANRVRFPKSDSSKRRIRSRKIVPHWKLLGPNG